MGFPDNPVLLPKIRSAAIMNAAKDMPCTLRVASFVPGRRCSHQTTNIMCHLPSYGKGTSTKSSDHCVAAGCFECHQIVDGPDKAARDFIMEKYPAAYMERLLRGMQETQAMLLSLGILTGPDVEIVL